VKDRLIYRIGYLGGAIGEKGAQVAGYPESANISPVGL
jgi:hypothetical protein